MMKRLLYLGNAVSAHHRNPTTIETLGSSLRAEGFEVIIASTQKNKFLRLLDILWHVVKYRNRVSIVIIDTYSTSSFWYAYLSGLFCKWHALPYVPILHGGNLEQRLKYSPKLSEQLFTYSKICVAPSFFMQQIFHKYGFTKVVVIPNAFELQNYIFKERSLLGPQLLWVRSLAQIYNPKMALEVLKIVQQSYPEAILTIVGPEKDVSKEQMQTWAKELGVDVTFTGQLPKSEWIELSKDFDIFINTTNVDNTPVSVIEAMALGLPVVSTNVGGVPFLIEHQKEGLLVPPNEPKSMANAIFELLEKPDLVRNITINARSKVEAFDWKIVKNQWVELLK